MWKSAIFYISVLKIFTNINFWSSFYFLWWQKEATLTAGEMDENNQSIDIYNDRVDGRN